MMGESYYNLSPLRRQQRGVQQEFVSTARRNSSSGSRSGDSNNNPSRNSIRSDNIISSTKSNTVKRIQAILSKRKKREEFGQTLVEGPRMVLDLLQSTRTRGLVQQVLVSTEEYSRYVDILQSLNCDDGSSLDIRLITPDVLKACTDTVTPQGILALVDIPKPLPSISTLQPLDSTCKHPLYLVLDGISDPGNLGTLLRSSLAVGVKAVMLLPGCCDVWNPKAVRSAMGASFQVPIVEVATWQEAVERLTVEGCVQSIYAATMMDEHDIPSPPLTTTTTTTTKRMTSRSHFDINWLEHPTAIVIGSEGNGLSLAVRQAIYDPSNQLVQAVHVPMQAGIESLNAAVCGSVILFEYSRQCNMT